MKSNKFVYSRKYIVIATLIMFLLPLVFIVCLTVSILMEDNEPVVSSREYNYDDIEDKFAIIDALEILDIRGDGYQIRVPFKDGEREIFALLSLETQLNMEEFYISPGKSYKPEAITNYIGYFDRSDVSGDIYFKEMERLKFNGFYDSPNMKFMTFIAVFLIYLIIIIFIINFQYLKSNKEPTLIKGCFISDDELLRILSSPPTIDNIWLDNMYLLINDSNLITAIDMSEIIWIWSDDSTYGYYVQLYGDTGKVMAIPFSNSVKTAFLYKLFKQKFPNIVYDYSKEKHELYKNNVDNFLYTYQENMLNVHLK